MKRFLLTLLFIFPVLITNAERQQAVQTVYICTGPKAVVYHHTAKCRGLSKCSGQIKKVNLAEIKKTRRACKICYK